MTRQRRVRPLPRRLGRWALLLAVGLAWFGWLRPTALGGRQSYAVVQGVSMEPTYQDGDLVIVREEDHYAIGDVIAFRAGGQFDDPTRIIHRIVGQATDDEFITQGDNRDRIDPWRPGADDILGRAVLHVPRAGDVASAAGRPEVLAALGGAAVITGGRKRRRRRPVGPIEESVSAPQPDGAHPASSTDSARGTVSRPAVSTGGAPSRWQRHTEPRWAFLGLVASAVIAVPACLGLWSASQAATTALRIEPLGELTQQVSVDYRFTGPASPVYPDGVVTTAAGTGGLRAPTGPLYSRLLDRLEVAIDFQSAETGAERLTSTYAVDVSVAMPEGFSRTLPSIASTPFSDGATQVVVVDLGSVAAQIAQVAELTGVGGDSYTITVTPRLDVVGTAGGSEGSDSLGPSVAFVVSDGVITAPPVGDTIGRTPLTRQLVESTDFSLGLVSVETPTARGLLGGLVLVTLVALGWCASVLFGGLGLSEADRIAARYRMQLVDVSSAAGPPGPVVMVGGIAELARLAKVDQSVILHEDLGDGSHRYRVFLGAVTYEYETAPDHGGAAVDADQPASPEL